MILLGNFSINSQHSLKRKIMMQLRRDVEVAKDLGESFFKMEQRYYKGVVLDISNEEEGVNRIISRISALKEQLAVLVINQEQGNKILVQGIRGNIHFIFKDREEDIVKLLDNLFLNQSKEYLYEDLKFNFENEKLMVRECMVELTTLESKISSILIKNRNQTCTREKIRREIMFCGKRTTQRGVDFHVFNIRRKLLDYGKLIKTRSGLGYIWRDDEKDGEK